MTKIMSLASLPQSQFGTFIPSRLALADSASTDPNLDYKLLTTTITSIAHQKSSFTDSTPVCSKPTLHIHVMMTRSSPSSNILWMNTQQPPKCKSSPPSKKPPNPSAKAPGTSSPILHFSVMPYLFYANFSCVAQLKLKNIDNSSAQHSTQAASLSTHLVPV
jgi:hypothetical protein